jgi:hypothetical protein
MKMSDVQETVDTTQQTGDIVNTDDAGQQEQSTQETAAAETPPAETPPAEPIEYGEFDISKGKDIGYEMSEERATAFKELAKGLGLTKEQAQALVDHHIGMESATQTKQAEFLKTYREDGLKETKDFYKEKYPEQAEKNNRAYEKFFTKEFRKQLDDWGTSAQLEFQKSLANIAAAISEDTTVPGDSRNTRGNTLKDSFIDLNKT